MTGADEPAEEQTEFDVVINAMGGRYYRSQVFVNDPVELGIDAAFENRAISRTVFSVPR